MTDEVTPAEADCPGGPGALTRPDAEDAAALAAGGIEQEALVTLFGRCTVEYEGRATSELGPGDRHLMLKPDGAALVHTDAGQQPANWQPPGSEHQCRVSDDDALVVESRRTAPEESLVVQFSAVVHAAAFAVDDAPDRTPEVVGTESDLKERVLQNPGLVEAGFAPLATERETPAGAVDVYGEDSEGRTVVLELKRRRVGPDAVGQLHRYVEALERDLHAEADVRGVLVAPSVTDRADALLAENGLEFVSLSPRGEETGRTSTDF